MTDQEILKRLERAIGAAKSQITYESAKTWAGSAEEVAIVRAELYAAQRHLWKALGIVMGKEAAVEYLNANL